MYREQKPPERPFLPETLLALLSAIYASRLALLCLPWDGIGAEVEAAVAVSLVVGALLFLRRQKMLAAAVLACTLVALISSAAFCARTEDAARAATPTPTPQATPALQPPKLMESIIKAPKVKKSRRK